MASPAPSPESINNGPPRRTSVAGGRITGPTHSGKNGCRQGPWPLCPFSEREADTASSGIIHHGEHGVHGEEKTQRPVRFLHVPTGLRGEICRTPLSTARRLETIGKVRGPCGSFSPCGLLFVIATIRQFASREPGRCQQGDCTNGSGFGNRSSAARNRQEV